MSGRREHPAHPFRAARRRVWSGVATVAAVAIALAGCTSGLGSDDGDDDDGDPAAAPAATVTIPQVRLTPFCQAMIDLADRLENDPPDDVRAEIVATYESIEDDVPDAIRADFDAVLAELRNDEPSGDTAPDATEGTPPPAGDDSDEPDVTDATGSTPSDPYFDEGYSPDDDPALRLNAYVDFECRDVANNPGPPATQPLSDDTSDGS